MMANDQPTHSMLERAQGCLVELQSPAQIRRAHAAGLRELADGGTWDTLAGQPTDDSEMALMLARSLAELGRFEREAVRRAYVGWLDSAPFDCGNTVAGGLRGFHNPQSQANGALTRISPLGIFGANHSLDRVADWARQDAALTQIHPLCGDANALNAMAIAHAPRDGCDGRALYERIAQ